MKLVYTYVQDGCRARKLLRGDDRARNDPWHESRLLNLNWRIEKIR